MEAGELAFEFFLADRLGRTVAELRESISQLEFMQWARHHAVKAQSRQIAEMAAAAKMRR